MTSPTAEEHLSIFPRSRIAGSNQKESDSLSTANIRFRYEPTLHATERFRVHAVLDIPDNLVLGSMLDGGPLSVNQTRRTA